ncbi:APC family permease [Pedobacter antarcticus]|uniref:Serine/threonine protein kinase n=2 Tax=Pedobacter antarcticus TaxID=34086 RepID=A0A081PIK6_9SPHI|nr:amino acid permease [Pedobacter antarcticus]KEQ30529.1 serine/threonine protein kinase [Pedobacter antarcticus 4BY]SDM80667.1 basic amino acid/polyamine antiporter, APA family [Pedobacter antarcticus]SFF37024.1 basic amino acid/polyamine antiporter, APA family [Pedobacter antarcticus]
MLQKKQLSLFDLSMIVVSLVIGMGIFRTPVNVAVKAQIPSLFFLAWLIGGLVAYCGALIYAEIGSRFPVNGGYYKIFSACYHPSIAFAMNGIIIVTNAAFIAGVTLIGSEYLSSVILPADVPTDTYRLLIAGITVLIFYGINLLGLKTSSKIQNILSIIKIVLILMLICALFTGSTNSGIPPVFKSVSGEAPGWADYGKALGLCLVAVSFSFGGYTQTINLGGEVREPKKILPKGIRFGILIVIALYMLINYAYVQVIGFEELKTADSIAAILAGKIFGPVGYTLLSGLIFLSVLGYVNVNLLSNPRALFAMGEEKALPAAFAWQHKKTGVMVFSLTAFTALVLIILFYGKTFDTLLNYTIILDCIGTASSAATLFYLRKSTAHLDKDSIFTLKWYPFIPIIFISFYIFVALSIYQDDPVSALNGLLVFAIFMLLYFIGYWARRLRSQRK